MPPKKGTKKKVAKKAAKKAIAKEVIYLDVEPEMSEIDIAGALNVPKSDNHRRAILQILDTEIEVGIGLLQGKADDHGKLAEAVGWLNAMRFVKAELESQYEDAHRKLHINAQMEDSDAIPQGY